MARRDFVLLAQLVQLPRHRAGVTWTAAAAGRGPVDHAANNPSARDGRNHELHRECRGLGAYASVGHRCIGAFDEGGIGQKPD